LELAGPIEQLFVFGIMHVVFVGGEYVNLAHAESGRDGERNMVIHVSRIDL
jgi:hypothetical protein